MSTAMRWTWFGLGLVAGAGTLNVVRRSRRSDHPSLLQATRSVAINRPAAELFAFWRKLENLPRVMEHIAKVTELDETRSHWVSKSIAYGPKMEWDARITREIPGALIAWASEGRERQPLKTQGSIRFEALSAGRGTLVTLDLELEPSIELRGPLHKLFEKGVLHHVTEDLRRFKQLSETGELPTTAGQTHGTRSSPMRALEAVSERVLSEPREPRETSSVRAELTRGES